MLRASEEYNFFFPSDLSGIVIFNKTDYTTLFFQFDFTQHTKSNIDVADFCRLLEFEIFSDELVSLKKTLIDKQLLVEHAS